MVPFEQNIFAYLIACKLALLILHTLDIRVLQGLGIEAYQFLTDNIHRTEPHQSTYPCEGVTHPALLRRRQCPFSFAAILEAWLSVSGLALSSVAPRAAQFGRWGRGVLRTTRELWRPE